MGNQFYGGKKMSNTALFKIIIVAFRLKERPAPKKPKIEPGEKVFTKRFGSSEEALAHAQKQSEHFFPANNGWECNPYVVETVDVSAVDKVLPAGIEGDLVKEYMREYFPVIKMNPVWLNAKSMNQSDEHKRRETEVGVILAFMRKGPNCILERKPTLPKERAFYWQKISEHIDSYLMNREAVPISAK